MPSKRLFDKNWNTEKEAPKKESKCFFCRKEVSKCTCEFDEDDTIQKQAWSE